jgi:hypothetical protein
MRLYAPAGRHRVVDDPPHDRMAEAEASRYGSRPYEVGVHQLVQQRKRHPLGALGDRRDKAGVEGFADDGRGIEHDFVLRPQATQLVGDQRADARGDRRVLDARLATRGVGRRARSAPRQLIEIERIAAALAVNSLLSGRVQRRTEQRPGLLRAERWQFEAAAKPCARARLERGDQACGSAPRRDRYKERSTEAAKNMRKDLDRGRVGPVDVVERQQHRLRLCKPLEQRPDRIVDAIALAAIRRDGPSGPEAGQRRLNRRELVERVGLKPVQQRGSERVDMVVERVDDDSERHVLLELGRAAVEYQKASFRSEAASLREQVGLADPGLSAQLDCPR